MNHVEQTKSADDGNAGSAVIEQSKHRSGGWTWRRRWWWSYEYGQPYGIQPPVNAVTRVVLRFEPHFEHESHVEYQQHVEYEPHVAVEPRRSPEPHVANESGSHQARIE